MNILLEKYVGVRPECALLEKEIGKLRALCEEKLSSKNTRLDVKGVNNSKEIKRIEILLSKLFKCKSVNLSVDPIISSNAYTLCKTFIGLGGNVKKDKNGELSADKLDIYITITYGLLGNKNFTDGEILAVILHEMGHNFYTSPHHWLSRLTINSPVHTLAIALGFDLINYRKGRFKFNNAVNSIAASIPYYIKVQRAILKFIGFISAFSLKTLVFIPKTFIIGDKEYIRYVPYDPMMSIFNYNVEKHADSVAVNYGYGEELARGLAKLNFNDQSFRYYAENNNSPIGIIYQLDTLFASHMSSIFSGYPTNQNRVKSAMNRIEQSMKDPNLDPKLKKELEGQYKSFKKWYEEEYITANEDDIRKVSMFYRKMSEEKAGGFFDLREIFAQTDPSLDPLK